MENSNNCKSIRIVDVTSIGYVSDMLITDSLDVEYVSPYFKKCKEEKIHFINTAIQSISPFESETSKFSLSPHKIWWKRWFGMSEIKQTFGDKVSGTRIFTIRGGEYFVKESYDEVKKMIEGN